jgi:imidazoleglycerol-phosphate dehydratase
VTKTVGKADTPAAAAAGQEQPVNRMGRIERTTKETKTLVEIDLDGQGWTDVTTGVGFFDHMLTSFGKHALFDLTVQVEGDLHIDAHHSVEDAAIALGQAFAQAAGDKAGIRRFGDALIPMDDALVQAAVDLSGRPYLVHSEPAGAPATIGPDYATTLTRHVFESFAHHAGVGLHVIVRDGRDWHHITEAQYKAVARALRAAVELDPRVAGVPSTKGVL